MFWEQVCRWGINTIGGHIHADMVLQLKRPSKTALCAAGLHDRGCNPFLPCFLDASLTHPFAAASRQTQRRGRGCSFPTSAPSAPSAPPSALMQRSSQRSLLRGGGGGGGSEDLVVLVDLELPLDRDARELGVDGLQLAVEPIARRHREHLQPLDLVSVGRLLLLQSTERDHKLFLLSLELLDDGQALLEQRVAQRLVLLAKRVERVQNLRRQRRR